MERPEDSCADVVPAASLHVDLDTGLPLLRPGRAITAEDVAEAQDDP